MGINPVGHQDLCTFDPGLMPLLDLITIRPPLSKDKIKIKPFESQRRKPESCIIACCIAVSNHYIRKVQNSYAYLKHAKRRVLMSPFSHHRISCTEVKVDVSMKGETARDSFPRSNILNFSHGNRRMIKLSCFLMAENPMIHDRKNILNRGDVMQFVEI